MNLCVMMGWEAQWMPLCLYKKKTVFFSDSFHIQKKPQNQPHKLYKKSWYVEWRNEHSFPDDNDNSGFDWQKIFCLVPASHSRSLGLSSGAKVSLVGLLGAVAIGVVAARRVVLTDLCLPLRWRLYLPGQEGGEGRYKIQDRQTEVVRGKNGEKKEEGCNQKQLVSLFGCFSPWILAL